MTPRTRKTNNNAFRKKLPPLTVFKFFSGLPERFVWTVFGRAGIYPPHAMKFRVSVPVPVKVIDELLAPAPLLELPGVVLSLVMTVKLVALVNDGARPVMVDVPPDRVA
jgi:hypothetical protein